MKYGQLTGFLINQGVLQDKKLIEAFNLVDRRDFLPESQKHLFLENRPLPIGFEQTNSQPFTVAFMLELLLPGKGDHILDVGSGSGWTATLMASIGAEVDAVELIPGLLSQAKSNSSKYRLNNLHFHQAGKKLGWPAKSPYNKIIVSAEAKELPDELIAQLSDGGRMVIPINESIWLVEKSADKLKIKKFDGFRFVPLVY